MTRSLRDLEARANEGKSTRESEVRAHDIREEYNMDYKSPLDIPPGVAREGWVQHWATTNIRGEPVYEVERLSRKGWQMVPSERAPNFAHDPLQRNPYCGKYLATKDMILMEIESRYLKRERDNFHHQVNNKLKSLRGVRDSFGNTGFDGNFTNSRINSF